MTTQELQQSAIRRFRNITGTGTCVLCGLPAKRAYCHAHSWAFGQEETATAGSPSRTSADGRRQEKSR